MYPFDASLAMMKKITIQYYEQQASPCYCMFNNFFSAQLCCLPNHANLLYKKGYNTGVPEVVLSISVYTKYNFHWTEIRNMNSHVYVNA